MSGGFRSPPVVPSLGAQAPAAVQAGMQSMLCPWMGGRAGAVAPVTTQAGMLSLVAPWMGGRGGAVAAVPPTPTPTAAGSRGGGAGGFLVDEDLRRLLDDAWVRGAQRREESVDPIFGSSSREPWDHGDGTRTETSSDTATEKVVEVVHHHHWWETEKIVERVVDRWRTLTIDASAGQIALAALGGAALLACGYYLYRAFSTSGKARRGKRKIAVARVSAGRFRRRGRRRNLRQVQFRRKGR